ncbi:MAG: hypothetical protein ACLU4J_02690 [Butyricimonas paravirosa]
MEIGTEEFGGGYLVTLLQDCAEANNLIQALEADKMSCSNMGMPLVTWYWEAYAIRSLMHFEVVRVFTKAPD